VDRTIAKSNLDFKNKAKEKEKKEIKQKLLKFFYNFELILELEMAAVTRSANASPSMLVSPSFDANQFPLKSIKDVVNFFKRSLELSSQNGVEPDLTVLSIIVGYVEISLTTGDAAQAATAAISAAEGHISTNLPSNTLSGMVNSSMQGSCEYGV